MPEKDSAGRKREYIHGHQGRGKTFSEEVRKTMSLGKKGKYTGENHWNWKGQKYTTDQRYIMTYAPNSIGLERSHLRSMWSSRGGHFPAEGEFCCSCWTKRTEPYVTP